MPRCDMPNDLLGRCSFFYVIKRARYIFSSVLSLFVLNIFCYFSPVIYAQNGIQSEQFSSYGNGLIYQDFINSPLQGEEQFSNISQPVTTTSNDFPFSIGNGTIYQDNGGDYIVLGTVSQPISMGNGNYDNIPFLNTNHTPVQRELPPLKVPQNDKEFIERVNALVKRFTDPKLSIQSSLPGRLLRYSLVAGADEVFLAPNTSNPQSSSGVQESTSMLAPIYVLGALGWNYPCANRQLLKNVNKYTIPEVGYGFQTQRGEFISALAFAKIDRNYELRVDGKKITVDKLIEWEKYSCSSRANLALVAIGLAHYIQNPDETWVNMAGETWSLARILEVESQRSVDWSSSDATDKLLAFTYLLARLKQSANASSPQLAPNLQKTEAFLVMMKKQVWNLFASDVLSDSLFFNTDIKIKTPYMRLYVNGKLLRWLVFVASSDDLLDDKMRKAQAELCALVDQLFNSLDDLRTLSAVDEESLCIALQTLSFYSKQLQKLTATP